MKEIKVRAWHKNIEWDGEGSMHEVLAISFELGFIFVPLPDEPREYRRLEMSDCTLRLFTGHLDKNGKELYAGDITKDSTGLCLIAWNDQLASFCLRRNGWAFDHFFGEAVNPSDVEVIGNIYENPELLK